MKQLRLFILLSLFAVLGACSLFGGDKEDRVAEALPLDQLYREAYALMVNGNYSTAVRYYRRLVARFPFGQYSEQAQLELAYCQYKNGDDEEALATINRFLKSYPTHPKVDYALFLRGLVNFDRNAGFTDRFMEGEAATRDQQSLRQAFLDFSELVKRYPNSAYAGDARQRMLFLRNNMAQFELNVARYYYRRGAYVAAANRAAYVVETYQQAPQSVEALELMASSYEQLGQDQLAADARRVMEFNAAERGTAAPTENKRSWWRRLWPFGSKGS
ncbi:MAG: outer membrane protein assembly factor BamD [Xanthomonadales bacterium]|nr:outer membrane protein assembly factor BamD [Xanthomonadales bacterium]